MLSNTGTKYCCPHLIDAGDVFFYPDYNTKQGKRLNEAVPHVVIDIFATEEESIQPRIFLYTLR